MKREEKNFGKIYIGFPASGCGPLTSLCDPSTPAAFLFLYFLKMFFTEIYFRFHILQFCTPTARQGGGRDQHVNKYKLFLRGGPWWEPAAPRPGGRHLPPGGGAACSLPLGRGLNIKQDTT